MKKFRLKKNVISFLLLVLFSNTLFAQDIMTKNDGEDIEVKVIEVSTSEIKYKKFANPEGPTYTELKSNIIMIRYENGSKDIFVQEKAADDIPVPVSPQVNQQSPAIGGKGGDDRNGAEDARYSYNGAHSGAGWVCATAIITSPILALVPALICQSVPPSDLNLNYPNSELMRDAAYANQYKKEAHKIKRKKIWVNFGIGTAVWGILVIMISS